MALWQGQSRRSKTGRKIRYARCKRKFEIGSESHLTTMGSVQLKKVRTRGNNTKTKVMTSNIAYVIDPKTHKTTKTEITTVSQNAANIHYVRRNILNKGAVVQTKIGKAKITSRPGQSGTINAILLPEK